MFCKCSFWPAPCPLYSKSIYTCVPGHNDRPDAFFMRHFDGVHAKLWLRQLHGTASGCKRSAYDGPPVSLIWPATEHRSQIVERRLKRIATWKRHIFTARRVLFVPGLVLCQQRHVTRYKTATILRHAAEFGMDHAIARYFIYYKNALLSWFIKLARFHKLPWLKLLIKTISFFPALESFDSILKFLIYNRFVSSENRIRWSSYRTTFFKIKVYRWSIKLKIIFNHSFQTSNQLTPS